MPDLSTRDNDLYRISHMISFCEKLIVIAKEADEPISEVTYLALLRLFETLGEAASKVSAKRGVLTRRFRGWMPLIQEIILFTDMTIWIIVRYGVP
jgi:hypothetical protein